MENFEYTAAEKALQEMFNRLVPISGKCEMVAGEIVRAYTRIDYRFYNDGDRIGVGYGKETCNAPARYLIEKCAGVVAETVEDIWGTHYEDDAMNDLADAVYEFLVKNPDLETVKNDEDMWDYTDEDEDKDDCWEDEDEEGEEDDSDY